MGIDVYLRWDGMTEEETKAQYTGFSIVHGHVGYLREAYHGGPYATEVLVPEAFEESEAVKIPVETLRERLPAAIEAAKERSRIVYHEDNPDERAIKSYIDFVELAEQKEREGKNPKVYVSA